MTKRSLLWGLFLAGVGGTLMGSTSAVRAATTTSSALGATLGDEGAVAKPYFWTAAELAQQAEQHQALISMPATGFPAPGGYCCYYVGGIGLPAARVFARALD